MTSFRKRRRAGDRGAGGMGDLPWRRGLTGGVGPCPKCWGATQELEQRKECGSRDLGFRGVGWGARMPLLSQGQGLFPWGRPQPQSPLQFPSSARGSQGLQEAFQHLELQTL